jgi:hypothetical protein
VNSEKGEKRETERERERAMPTIEKLYSMKEVAEHNSADDCWIVVDGKVLSLVILHYFRLVTLFIIIKFQVASSRSEAKGNKDWMSCLYLIC